MKQTKYLTKSQRAERQHKKHATTKRNRATARDIKRYALLGAVSAVMLATSQLHANDNTFEEYLQPPKQYILHKAKSASIEDVNKAQFHAKFLRFFECVSNEIVLDIMYEDSFFFCTDRDNSPLKVKP